MSSMSLSIIKELNVRYFEVVDGNIWLLYFNSIDRYCITQSVTMFRI